MHGQRVVVSKYRKSATTTIVQMLRHINKFAGSKPNVLKNVNTGRPTYYVILGI